MGRGRTATDITGKRFGYLTVIEKDGKNKWGEVFWKCICDCGNKCVCRGKSLKNGDTKSCGCGIARPDIERIDKRIISIWAGMYSRCYNEKATGYKNYGGRGIKICDEWIEKGGCRHFYEWAMKSGYREYLTIDRKDVNGNYEPANCRWITMAEQMSNMRKSIRILYNGEKVSPAELSKITGINVGTIYSRYYRERNANGNESMIDFTDWKPREW